jgi:hypothetical protein
MKRVAFAFLAVSLLAGGMVLPAEATGWHHTYRGRHIRHRRPTHGRFVRGFLAGAGTVLVVKTLHTPRVVYRTPVVYDRGVYRAPVCQTSWVPGRWEVRTQTRNGFTSYYHVRVEGHWQQQCSR